MHHSDHEFDTDVGGCRYTAFGGADYRAHWGRYEYGPGLVYSARADEPSVAIYLQLEGTGERSAGTAEADLALRSGESNVVVAPAAEVRGEITRPLRGAAFEAVLSRNYFILLAERHPELLAELAEWLVANRAGTFSPVHRRITPRMWSIVRKLQVHAGSTGAGSLLLEASIVELLALLLAQPPRAASPGRIALSPADIDGIHAARDLLLERLDDPPTLAELARRAVTNEFKLKRGFREIFGSSPYAYFLKHRLELARRYLLDTDWPIAAIARRVGYSDPAHLTNAFRKHFGVPPSALR